MRLTIQLKLLPTPDQANALKRTLETANAACDYISQVVWQSTTFRQFAIHKLTYQSVRETFGLAAQLAVRCIAKVADAYKLDRKTQRSFVPHGAVPYDDRILSYALPDSLVSIWTLDGRQAIPFVCGFAGPADMIAAGNIACRAPVSTPDCSEAIPIPACGAQGSVAPGQSPSLKA